MIEPALPPSREDLEQALAFSEDQVRALIAEHPGFFPLFTEGGKWRHDKESWTNWCEGFLPGMMWIFARRTGSPFWREKAEQYSRSIVDRRFDRQVHDLGFLFWSSWKRWHDWEGTEEARQVVVDAGATMGKRFHEPGKYLRSFIAPESTFIDIMMNAGIIFYAGKELADGDLVRRASEHCATTRRFLVRGDGSTAHEGIFDLDSGEFLRQSTHQGWRGDSSWARGQAWALYGFGTVYRMSGDLRFLDAARRCARYFIDRTGPTGVPPNDWDEPSPALAHESSAAAIAGSGFLQLAVLVSDHSEAQEYAGVANRIATTLLDPAFLAARTQGWEGILKGASYHQRLGLGVNESVMWGDYFFVELLDKLLGSPWDAP